MKYISIVYILLLFSVSVPCKSSAFKLPKHKDILKAQTSVYSAGNNIGVDSIVNNSISINGTNNTVKIKTDSLSLKTAKSITNQSKDSNTIEINGEGNSVSVNQNPKAKVEVKQSGNNNSIKISQSNHQP